MDTATRTRLERRVFAAIVEFPERLDLMETRNDDACARLAKAIVTLVDEELAKPPSSPR